MLFLLKMKHIQTPNPVLPLTLTLTIFFLGEYALVVVLVEANEITEVRKQCNELDDICILGKAQGLPPRSSK